MSELSTRRCVVLVRHGRTTLNAEGQLRGHLDPPLDDVGIAEVIALATALGTLRVQRILTSPLRRAAQTAQAIAGNGGAEIIEDPRLIDRDYGQWAGQRLADVTAQWGTVDEAPGVEAASDVAARARIALNEQAAFLSDGPVVLVAHDAVDRLLLAELDPRLRPAESIGQRTACWNVLTLDGGVWRVTGVDHKADAIAVQAAE